MSGLWRSEDMKYVSVTMTNESAHSTIKQIGRFGLLHLVDLSSGKESVSKQSLNMKKRLADCMMYERKLDAMREQLQVHHVIAHDSPPLYQPKDMQLVDTLDNLNEWLEPLEKELVVNINSERDIDIQLARLTEHLQVLKHSETFDSITAHRELVETSKQKNPIDNAPHIEAPIGAVELSERKEQPQQQSGHRLASYDSSDDNKYSENENSINNNNSINSSNNSSLSKSSVRSFRSYIAGVIDRENVHSFQRMLYRVTRGNVLIRIADIDDDEEEDDDDNDSDNNNIISQQEEEVKDDEKIQRRRIGGGGDSRGAKYEKYLIEPPVPRSVFHIVFIGRTMGARIRKICELVKARIYPVPEHPSELREQFKLVDQELRDKTCVSRNTRDSTLRVLTKIAGDSTTCPIRDWEEALRIEKCICSALLYAHHYYTMITLEGWVPAGHISELKRYTRKAVDGTNYPPAAIEIDPATPIQTPDTPPSYFKTTKFTAPYQNIVDTYGTPRYKEVNPGLFTIITFPFLFGIMYGDMGHGVFLTVFAIYLILNEKSISISIQRKQLNEIGVMAFGGRYMIILMGIFAVYCGIIYNDCFSIPVNVYGSNWTPISSSNSTSTTAIIMYESNLSVYPVGIDPAWSHADNSMAFYNSFKMKLAVMLGVTQMLFGIFLSFCNHLYFKDYISIYFEFIPRIIFMLCTFGYMDFLIVYKWSVDWTGRTGSAPSLIQTMIKMFLSPGSVEADKQLYDSQATVQVILLLAAVFSVPVMLFAKPIINHRKHNPNAFVQKHSPASLPQHRPQSPSHDAGDRPFVIDASSAVSSNDEAAVKIVLDFSEREPTSGNGVDHDKELVDASHGGIAPLSPDHSRRASLNFKDAENSSPQSPSSASASDHSTSKTTHSLSDELIHQAIHTIEFVLGAVSNTASYLRLWALSLAHAELARVFWEKMLSQYGYTENVVFTFIATAVWCGATFAVLLCMDTLECFLHALRLHWVEFQNKFYYADGKPFVPFRLEEEEVL